MLEILHRVVDASPPERAYSDVGGLADECAGQGGDPVQLAQTLISDSYPLRLDAEGIRSVQEARVLVRWLQRVADQPAFLLEVALHQRVPWYVRDEAFRALADEKYAAQAPRGSDNSAQAPRGLDNSAQAPRGLDDEDIRRIAKVFEAAKETGEVRAAALEVLVACDRRELLPRVERVRKRLAKKAGSEDWWGGERLASLACVALGDTARLNELLQGIFNPWTFQRTEALKTLERLAPGLEDRERLGLELASQAGLIQGEGEAEPWVTLQCHPEPAVVRWALQQMPIASDSEIKLCVRQLDSEDWGICDSASLRLSQDQTAGKVADDVAIADRFAELQAAWMDTSLPQSARSWAAYTLVRCGRPVTELIEAVEQQSESRSLWRAPWPFEAPDEVRAAVLRWAGDTRETIEQGTDVRYCLEFLYQREQPGWIDYDEERATADRERLVEAIKAKGFSVPQVRECGEVHEQGSGTYWVVTLDDTTDSPLLYVSTLGPFLSAVRTRTTRQGTGQSVSWELGIPMEQWQPGEQQMMQQCRELAEQQGFHWLEGALLGNVPPQLNVYFFGAREPLSISDLLYYWQD